MKKAFVFPGQGSQYIGMGKDFYDNFPASKAVIDLASEVSGFDMKALLFEENDRIDITKYTQIAMLADELAIWSAVRERGFSSDVNAGLSLGEYAAMAASGVISLEDAFYVIVKRAAFMQDAVPSGGGMTAVMGLDNPTIERICSETEGIVSVANYNCPGQTVITGEKEAVDRAAEAMKAAGAKRCLPLNVSWPFHSEMLVGAGEKLRKVLDGVAFSEPDTPYISNVTADYVTNISRVEDLLVRQISSPVRWEQSVGRMIADGVDVFIEIGPKRSLTGFLKKIDREIPAFHVDTVSDLDKLCEELEK